MCKKMVLQFSLESRKDSLKGVKSGIAEEYFSILSFI